ncbi:hypothetical protein PRIPAC_92205 [Pristionchus pacificus]|uniref:Uncharacterized protein n=1 Tax=Pristionchus pacificus TaxID=54126 RepID=A0A2A6BBH6_PRIPA|nr:hypothetical protein PRIPAC_92205 [Pristionchus pacificus]|eukprot:PDM63235.1 hypothetical protein PRIPAC_50450 [Pristionchus pacificus]
MHRMGRHIDYDRPRAVPKIKQSTQMTTEELIRALIAKDTLMEVARVPTHILDAMLHAEPVDDVIKTGSVDVTRIALSRWRSAVMAPMGTVAHPETPSLGYYPEDSIDKDIPTPPPPPLTPMKDSTEVVPMEISSPSDAHVPSMRSLLKTSKSFRVILEKNKRPRVEGGRKRGGKRRQGKQMLQSAAPAESAADAAVPTVPPAPTVPTVPAEPVAAAAPAAVLTPKQTRKLAAAASIAAARKSAADSAYGLDPTVYQFNPPLYFQPVRSTPVDYRTSEYRDHWAMSPHHSAAPSTSTTLNHQQPVNYTRPRHDDHLMPMDYGRIRPADPMTGRPRHSDYYTGPQRYSY